ncbi:hypothetical protein GQ457_18G000100 [Hibiscus cannabinus]
MEGKGLVEPATCLACAKVPSTRPKHAKAATHAVHVHGLVCCHDSISKHSSSSSVTTKKVRFDKPTHIRRTSGRWPAMMLGEVRLLSGVELRTSDTGQPVKRASLYRLDVRIEVNIFFKKASMAAMKLLEFAASSSRKLEQNTKEEHVQYTVRTQRLYDLVRKDVDPSIIEQ